LSGERYSRPWLIGHSCGDGTIGPYTIHATSIGRNRHGRKRGNTGERSSLAVGDALVTCVARRAAAPDLPVFALANSPKIAQALRDLGVDQTLSSDELVAHVLAKSLEAPHAGDLLLRAVGQGANSSSAAFRCATRRRAPC
jgi:hypothetical protein